MRSRKGKLRLAILAVLGLALSSAGLAGARLTTDIPPTLSASDLTVPATYDCFETFCASVPVSSFPLTVTDPDDPPDQITISCNNLNAPMFFWGTSMVTCQAQDPAGNHSAPVMFRVNVTLPPPTFQNVPAAITTTATGQFGAVVTFFPPTAADVGGRAVPVTCDHLSGITYPIGTTTVTCSATIQRNDSNGTPITGLPTGTSQFAVTVTPAGTGGGGSGGGGGGGGSGGGTTGGTTSDTTAPTLSQHPDVKVNATSPRGAAVEYALIATDPDNAPSQLTTACLPAPGSTFALGAHAATRVTMVTCRAHDPAGNQAAPVSFTVTVLGSHDQITALERQVSATKTLSKARRQALVLALTKADRDVRLGAKTNAKSKLGSFIARVGQVPGTSHVPKGKWIGAAARVIAVLG